MNVIIGAGPIGLAMAIRLLKSNKPFTILEKGFSVGSNMLDWGHIHLFTSWKDSIDPVSLEFLKENGIDFSLSDSFPSGAEYVKDFLMKLSNLIPSDSIKFGSEVKSINYIAETKEFEIRYQKGNAAKVVMSEAVFDASGTWSQPKVIFNDQHLFTDKIYSGIPDTNYIKSLPENSQIAVIGSGHSAMNSLMEIASNSNHKLTWLIRNDAPRFGQSKVGGKSDFLEKKVAELIKDKRIELKSGFSIKSAEGKDDGFLLKPINNTEPLFVNRLISNIGAFPDYSILNGFNIELDESLMIPLKMVDRIDPRLHSCDTVSFLFEETIITNVPYYVIGMKSFGKASNFLLSKGFNVLDEIMENLFE